MKLVRKDRWKVMEVVRKDRWKVMEVVRKDRYYRQKEKWLEINKNINKVYSGKEIKLN